MTDDLVSRLRALARAVHDDHSVADDAADEIEHLRAELADGSFYKEADIDRLMDRAEKAEAEIERLRELRREYKSLIERRNCHDET